MNNLKVNAKTPILEFKRKHNLLVESEEEKVNVLTVSNIQSLTNDEINSLKCGDIVAKEDSTGKHSYIVTFKKDNVGICLSYFDGSGYLETVSYDYNNGNWVYNSTDVFKGNEILPSTESASAGQILGLNNDKEPQWQNAPSGGTKLYKHELGFTFTSTNSGDDVDGSNTIPITLICSFSNEINAEIGNTINSSNGLISGCNDDSYNVYSIAFDPGDNNTLKLLVNMGSATQNIEYINITDFTDIVTEL